MLQCTSAKRLGNKKALEGNAWISLGRGSRIDVVGGMAAGRYGNMGSGLGRG